MPGEFANLEMGFPSGKAFQDLASPDDGVDRISFAGVRSHFTITTIDSLLHHFIFQLKMFVNKYFSQGRGIDRSPAVFMGGVVSFWIDSVMGEEGKRHSRMEENSSQPRLCLGHLRESLRGPRGRNCLSRFRGGEATLNGTDRSR